MMRIALVVAVLWSGLALGADGQQAAVLPGEVSVLLLPLSPVGETKMAWVGQAVQQNLLMELSKANSIQPIAPKGTGAAIEDVDAAKKAASEVGAGFVMFGSVQEGAAGLRITGQVLEVRSGRYIGGVKATG